ncbi:MAG TPA: carboxypeptidase-like regulatory domain-containing protein, partial [Arthrobacter sp.]|nr:carboxypeptidase-like regulatory domain-containing protein [Arthrobacter sp.]
MGAISASILAILLVAAPASQATSPSPTPSPSITTFQNNISGFLRDDNRAPIADVTITAKSGDFTGTATSAANGSWSIGVPVQGTYEIELDESTLPEGIRL